MGSTNPKPCNVTAVPDQILQRNPHRGSYYIINQHPALNIWVASGDSAAARNVAAAGAHLGTLIGPNGGQLYDDNDKDEVWAVSTAVNNMVIVIETIKSPKLVESEREYVPRRTEALG